MGKGIKESFSGFGGELLKGLREKANERINETAFEERMIGIEKATISMLEAGVEDVIIIQMLQKHWDLRLSESKEILETGKEILQ